MIVTIGLSWIGNQAEAQSVSDPTSSAKSATGISVPDGLTAAQIDKFIALLPDKDARSLLRSSLIESVAVPAAIIAGSTFSLSQFLEEMRNGSSELSDNFSKIVAILPNTGEVADHALLLLTDLEGPERMWLGVFNLIAMIVFGVIAGRLVSRLFGGVEKQFLLLQSDSQAQKFKSLLLRTAVELVELAAVFVTGQIVSLLYFDRFDPMRLFLLAWFSTICIFFLAQIFGRLIVSPSAPNLRLARLGDQAARNSYGAIVWAISIATFTMLNMAMFVLLGVPGELLTVWQLIGGTVIAGVVVFFLNRKPKQQFVANTDRESTNPEELNASTDIEQIEQRTPHRSFRQTFALLKIFGGALLYILWARAVISQDTPGAMAVVLIIVAFFTSRYLNLLKFKNSRSSIAIEDDGPHIVARAVSWFFGVIAALAFAQTAGLDIYNYLQTSNGQSLKWVVFQIVATIAVALLVWNGISTFMRRYADPDLEGDAEATNKNVGGDEGGGPVTSRVGTLLPLFHGFALVLVAVIALMFILSAVGINIGPLIAGAGVLGIAIGFGAQTLVKDIFSGIFFLVDDAFRIGEYVETGTYAGVVEKISIRSMQLRHHRGPIHTVPFGELRAITNHNRDWVIYKQDFELPYETDIEKVRKIIKKVGQEIMEDPVHGVNIISPVKSQGVKRVENGALIIGTKFTCKPTHQWLIRRYVYQQVRDRLYEAGISLATRRVQVEMPESVVNFSGPAEINPNKGFGLPAAAIAATAAMAVLDDDTRAKLAATEVGEDTSSME